VAGPAAEPPAARDGAAAALLDGAAAALLDGEAAGLLDGEAALLDGEGAGLLGGGAAVAVVAAVEVALSVPAESVDTGLEVSPSEVDPSVAVVGEAMAVVTSVGGPEEASAADSVEEDAVDEDGAATAAPGTAELQPLTRTTPAAAVANNQGRTWRWDRDRIVMGHSSKK